MNQLIFFIASPKMKQLLELTAFIIVIAANIFLTAKVVVFLKTIRALRGSRNRHRLFFWAGLEFSKYFMIVFIIEAPIVFIPMPLHPAQSHAI